MVLSKSNIDYIIMQLYQSAVLYLYEGIVVSYEVDDYNYTKPVLCTFDKIVNDNSKSHLLFCGDSIFQ